MKKNVSNIVIFAIFLLGICIFLYPMASNYLYEKASVKASYTYQEEIKKITPEQIEAEEIEAQNYNASLYSNPVILTEPFDPDSWPLTDGAYGDMLDLTEEMAFIDIPKINQKLPIYHGTTNAVLDKGVGHLENTSLPVGGPSTHSVLSAHCGLPKAELFTHLDKLEKGDIFTITVLNQKLAYEVYAIEVVEPKQVDSLYIQEGKDLVTLVTCTPYGVNSHRLLVHAERCELPEDSVGATFDEGSFLISIAIVCLVALLLFLGFLIALLRKHKNQTRIAANADFDTYSRYSNNYRKK